MPRQAVEFSVDGLQAGLVHCHARINRNVQLACVSGSKETEGVSLSSAQKASLLPDR